MPPRILVLTPDFPPSIGGIQRLLERLARSARRVEMEILTVAAQGAAEWDAVQPFGVHRSGPAPSRQLGIVRLNVEAVAMAARLRPDVVLAGHVLAAPAAIAIKRL